MEFTMIEDDGRMQTATPPNATERLDLIQVDLNLQWHIPSLSLMAGKRKNPKISADVTEQTPTVSFYGRSH